MKEDNECQGAVTYEISDSSESSEYLESKVYNQASLTSTSVLEESSQTSVKPRIFVNAFASPLLWLPRNLVSGSSHPICFKDLSPNIGTQGLDPKNSLATNVDKMQREQASNTEKCTKGPALKHLLTTHLDETQRNQTRKCRKKVNGIDVSTWENSDSKSIVQISMHSKPVGERNKLLKTITNTIKQTDNSHNSTSTKLISPPPTMVSTLPLSPPMVPTKSLSLPPSMEVATPPPAPTVRAKCLTNHSLTTNVDKMQREQPSNFRKRTNGVKFSASENPDSRCRVQVSEHNKPVGERNQPLKRITNTIQESDNSSNNTSAKLIFPPPSTVSTPPLPPPTVPAKSPPLPYFLRSSLLPADLIFKQIYLISFIS